MYWCRECYRKFDYPDYVERFYEDLCGVRSQFNDRHYAVFAECPYCGAPIDVREDEIDDDDE